MPLGHSLRAAAGFVFAAAASLLVAQIPQSSVGSPTSQPSVGKCAQLFGAQSRYSELLHENVITPSDTEKERLKRERVCIGSYSFPGGEKAFMSASSASIKADKMHLEALFAYYDKLPASAKQLLAQTPDKGPGQTLSFHNFMREVADISTNDWIRLVVISQGVDREQMRLLGQFMYMQALRREGHYQRCALIFDEMMRSGKLSLKPHNLDWMEQHTYLTAQSLRNLIAAEGFAAKASLPSAGLSNDAELVAGFLDSQSALLPIFTSQAYIIQVPDPSARILKRLAVLKPDTLASVRDQLPNIGAVAGLIEGPESTTVFLQGAEQLHAIEVLMSGEVSVLPGQAAAAKLTAFNRRQVVEHSTDDMTLYNVLKYRDGSAEIDMGGNLVSLSAGDVKHLESGQRLPDSHPLTLALKGDNKAKVMYANVLMQKSGSYLANGDALTFALRRSYPEVNIYRDPLSDQTNERVKDLMAFGTVPATNLAAIVADDSFTPRVQDFDVIKSAKAGLEAAGVKVITYHDGTALPWSGSKGNGLIVITAHSNEALARFVDTLGSQGVFDGNYILFNACGTPLTRSLADKINTEYKAVATLTYQGNVPVQSMKLALASLSESLKAGSSFNNAVTRALQESDLNGVWHVSEMKREIDPLGSPTLAMALTFYRYLAGF
jgi:hypothetical protein